MMPATIAALSESAPADGDTMRASCAFTSTGKAPRLSTAARSSASPFEKLPVIATEPVKFGWFTCGDDCTTLSRAMAI